MYSFRNYDLPNNKELRNALHVINGISWRKSILYTTKCGFYYPFNINNLNYYNFNILFYLLNKSMVSDVKVKRFINSNINRLMDIQCYKGFRHRDYLPVRGQRSRTNACTRRRMKLKNLARIQKQEEEKKRRRKRPNIRKSNKKKAKLLKENAKIN